MTEQHYIAAFYDTSDQEVMRHLSGGIIPADGSHVCYTTVNPSTSSAGGCGHVHRDFAAAVSCTRRHRIRYAEHRLIVGLATMHTPEQVRRLFTLGSDIAKRNAAPEEVEVPEHLTNLGYAPAYLDQPITGGVWSGKTWRYLTTSPAGLDWLAWAVVHQMERTDPMIPSKGEMAAPVLHWWQVERSTERDPATGWPIVKPIRAKVREIEDGEVQS